METLLEQEFFGNTVQAYAIVLGGILLGFLLVTAFKKILLRRLHALVAKTDNSYDDFAVETVSKFMVPMVYFVIIYAGLKTLVWPERFANILEVVFVVILTYYAIRFVSSVILMLLRTYIRGQEGGEEKVKQMGGIILIVNVVIWITGLVFMFGNLGYDVTAIIAGMGIGGIAIALAAQNILGDLFNYFVIFFDRPFEVGDFLVIGDKNGVVEKIGIKTTRVATLSGEQLVFSNSDLTSSRIHNYKKMQRRRIVFAVGVTYETSPEDLRAIPSLLQEIVSAQKDVTFDRAHFKAFGDSSLDFEIVYYVENAEYNAYMDIQQEINLQIYEQLGNRGISLAFPTRTLYIRNENGMKFHVNRSEVAAVENGSSQN
ncbi:mechanosensitive ion channel family protein [Algoriphagus sp. H41]|uniref:Mechanosensitive ion channel family protein n=1 Tax=Algoriphagus oliviformis TaxID=2811231 RepID=A0ABS3C7I7_9BACT|nr:mechanosensitive ion channel family protein [Algoriphagus oliviformis]MBN7813066.1 mechanosensitive ion channel family protein [Algoriphagus oliviformis]